MKKRSAERGLTFIVIGLLCIAAALSLAGYNVYTDARAGRSVRQVLDELDGLFPETTEATDSGAEITDDPVNTVMPEPVADIPDYILYPDMEMPVRKVDGKDYIGVLRIDSLSLELPVISDWSYESLKTAPCRYSGSAYKDNLVVCGHDYRSHFGGLRRIGIGDTATFTDMDGNVFTYRAASVEALDPTEIDDMKHSGFELTLFTCTLDGTDRLTVRFEKTE